MNHIGLFEGIGGFSLAARWMGWDTIAWCEWNEFCQKTLSYHFPNAIGHGDITKTDFTIYRGKCDILTGGWPCQDNSKARQVSKNGRGLSGEKSSKFYEFERTFCEIRPKYIIGENVSNVLTINGGHDFNYILSSLARMGYNAEWKTVRASDIGAPHHRERLYLVAYPNSIRLQENQSFFRYVQAEEREKERRIVAGATCLVRERWAVEPPVLRMDDGVSDRIPKIEALGNALIPDIPFLIFKAIEEFENLMHQQ